MLPTPTTTAVANAVEKDRFLVTLILLPVLFRNRRPVPHPFIRQAETGGENYKHPKEFFGPPTRSVFGRNAHAARRQARLACLSTTKKRSKTILRHRPSGRGVAAASSGQRLCRSRAHQKPGPASGADAFRPRRRSRRGRHGGSQLTCPVQNSHEAGAGGEIPQGIDVADTAKTSGIAHFIYISVAGANGTPAFRISTPGSESRNTSAAPVCTSPSCGRYSLWKTGSPCGRRLVCNLAMERDAVGSPTVRIESKSRRRMAPLV